VDTSCPNCDAPARDGTRSCASCGYDLLDDGRRRERPRLGIRAVAGLAGAAAVVPAAVIALGDSPQTPAAAEPSTGRDVLSQRPLSARAAERVLEARFTSLRDDDTAAARCSIREARPTYSIRRCKIRYPSGLERVVFLFTDGQGRELLFVPQGSRTNRT
jgi:hypothetical protein